MHALRALCFACVNFFNFFQWFISDKLSKDLLDRFSSNLHRIIGIWSQITDPTLIFSIAQGRCHDNQSLGEIMRNWTTHLHSPNRLVFQNGVEYRNSDCKRFCDNLARKNVVNFGPVTPELNGLKFRRSAVSYVRLAAPLHDTVGSMLSFVGRSVLSFVSPICYRGRCYGYAAQATR